MTLSLSPLWADIAAGRAKGYARDLAAQAGATEAQLVAAGCGDTVTRLDVNWEEGLSRLESLGEVKVITRNDAIVHEKVGRFGKVTVTGTTGLVLNGEVDLRLFLGHWCHSFAVRMTTRHGERQAIQVFDLHGEAVHKIWRTDNSDAAAWDALVAEWAAADQSPGLTVLPPRHQPPQREDAVIDVAGLRAHWQALKDVHHFHGMLEEFGVSRHQAMRLAGADLARQTAPDVLGELLTRLRDGAVPFMVFVGNSGCIQIHTGTVQRVVEKDGWVNVMDPRFNLHVRADQIASAWVVHKPTRDGGISTLELYDNQGRNVAILCGERQPGTPERAEWRGLLADLPAMSDVRAA